MERTAAEMPVITVNRRVFYRIAKRAFDIFASLLGLIICSPLFLVVAVAIKAEDPNGRIFYNQPRIGLNGSTFSCHKFRSMYSNADEIKASLMDQNDLEALWPETA